MFHRRLALVLSLMIAAVCVLTAQLGRLTIVHGAEHLERAERRLVTLEWIPTMRGPILDRQGRVLAKDRPSFNVTVDYSVLSGEWVTVRAATLAKRLYGASWKTIAPEERKELIEQCRVPFAGHIEHMWDVIADAARMNRADVDERREKIIWSVENKQRSKREKNITSSIDDKLKMGQEITEDVEEEIVKKAAQPIREQKLPHVLLPKIDDAVGFALQKLAAEQVEIAIPTHLFPTGGKLQKPFVESVLPGLVVVSAGDREYPMDHVLVDMDLGSLPGPMKKPGQRAKIAVEGVAFHILGRVETNAHENRTVEKDKKLVVVPSHAARRAARLKVIDGRGMHADEAFANRVQASAEAGLPEGLRDLGRYEYNDDSGMTGVEESREAELRGLRGANVVKLETGERSTIAPVHGASVQLTIDVALQARVQAAMSPEFGLAVAQPWHAHGNPTVPPGTHLNGAAVVIDVDSGDILALVSTPSVPRDRVRHAPESIFGEALNQIVDLPWVNRATARPYPPGSIVKALILNGAVKFGKLNLDQPIDCTGHLFPNEPNMFRCWIYKDKRFLSTHTAYFGHAPLGPEALMVSCNIYFFTLGQRLGPQGIMDTYAMFGLGQEWNLGIGMEYEGAVGGTGRKKSLNIQDAIQMGIGQGPVDWTPLHAADAYATLARGGKRITPHIVKGETPVVQDIELDPRAVKEALEGLSMSVNDSRGTGHHVEFPASMGGERVTHFDNLPGIKVWGKTGTAQAPTITQRFDERTGTKEPLYDEAVEDTAIQQAADPSFKLKPGYRALRWGDHSWFVVLVGHESDQRPLYAIAVMMEYAGSGGKVSGPIVNQVIRALMTEGYL